MASATARRTTIPAASPPPRDRAEGKKERLSNLGREGKGRGGGGEGRGGREKGGKRGKEREGGGWEKCKLERKVGWKEGGEEIDE